MIQAGRTLFLTSFATLLLVATIHGQDQRGGPGGPQGGSAAGARGGPGFGALPAPPPPKPLIPNAKPVRSCESLATVSLPNATIESAAVDPNNPGICRVTAFTTDFRQLIWSAAACCAYGYALKAQASLHTPS